MENNIILHPFQFIPLQKDLDNSITFLQFTGMWRDAVQMSREYLVSTENLSSTKKGLESIGDPSSCPARVSLFWAETHKADQENMAQHEQPRKHIYIVS